MLDKNIVESTNSTLTRLYYTAKPAIPRSLQLRLRRWRARQKRQQFRNVWPIDPGAAVPPQNWSGWPVKKRFAVVLTHDVESAKGHEKCLRLADLEASLGFKSSFNLVPERYSVSAELRQKLVELGFEIGVHGLNHDGKLFRSMDIFEQRARAINRYLEEWDAVGFRAPAMHHRFDWLLDLDIEYDASSFDSDPFEPQCDGVKTIFPFQVISQNNGKQFVELPYTLPQDHCLFIILREKNIGIWQDKVDWIAKNGGMVLVNTHPDYMNFHGGTLGEEEYPVAFHEALLNYLKKRYAGQYWHALPRDVARFFQTTQQADSHKTKHRLREEWQQSNE